MALLAAGSRVNFGAPSVFSGNRSGNSMSVR